MNPERISMPDIDIDICQEKTKSLTMLEINTAMKSCCPISFWNTKRLRAAVEMLEG